jgi:hypothetical protein
MTRHPQAAQLSLNAAQILPAGLCMVGPLCSALCHVQKRLEPLEHLRLRQFLRSVCVCVCVSMCVCMYAFMYACMLYVYTYTYVLQTYVCVHG